jgi:Dynamin family
VQIMTASMRREASTPSDQLINWLDRAAVLVEAASGTASPLYRRLQSLRERLRHQQLQIAVLGQFKRGKSTFINALLGIPILPSAVVPLTAIPTFISWGEKPLVQITFSNGSPPECFQDREVSAARRWRRRARLTEQTNEMIVRNAENFAVGNTAWIGRNIQGRTSQF